MEKGDVFQDDFLEIRAFGSTDIGVSFLVKVEGKTVFHAGDLNNWHWMDESPEAEWKHDEAFFLRELEDIAIYTDRMDVVLFPVDPRLGREYMRGPVQFVKRIKPLSLYRCILTKPMQRPRLSSRWPHRKARGCGYLHIGASRQIWIDIL